LQEFEVPDRNFTGSHKVWMTCNFNRLDKVEVPDGCAAVIPTPVQLLSTVVKAPERPVSDSPDNHA
jgi:hypothetical protein